MPLQQILWPKQRVEQPQFHMNTQTLFAVHTVVPLFYTFKNVKYFTTDTMFILNEMQGYDFTAQ